MLHTGKPALEVNVGCMDAGGRATHGAVAENNAVV